MMDDLVKRLRTNIAPSLSVCREAADRIEQLEARIAKADALVESATELQISIQLSVSDGVWEDISTTKWNNLTQSIAAYREGDNARTKGEEN